MKVTYSTVTNKVTIILLYNSIFFIGRQALAQNEAPFTHLGFPAKLARFTYYTYYKDKYIYISNYFS